MGIWKILGAIFVVAGWVGFSVAIGATFVWYYGVLAFIALVVVMALDFLQIKFLGYLPHIIWLAAASYSFANIIIPVVILVPLAYIISAMLVAVWAVVFVNWLISIVNR